MGSVVQARGCSTYRSHRRVNVVPGRGWWLRSVVSNHGPWWETLATDAAGTVIGAGVNKARDVDLQLTKMLGGIVGSGDGGGCDGGRGGGCGGGGGCGYVVGACVVGLWFRSPVW